MPAIDVPFLGTLLISATLVAAAYTFAIGVATGRGRPQMLGATRYGAYATAALVALGICLLAYAFQTHDFRIRYVARYSDRSMEWWYLVTSLWGGQDGSLLWWSFLLAGWSAACVRWMKGRFTELQPWVIATLMSIIAFFQILMLFAANPFAMTPASTPLDGEGLNPLLQNYWMIIHPPTLYMGFVGWAVPFSFAVAALVTGRLHNEWLLAIRKWTLMVWLFLSCGLLLGALWSYEELGWGGYWAWDPVENASFMPFLVGTAFLHSVIIQERYGMLKGWNIFLIFLTFFMTIFGTFLTRSGLIASVHAFAESDIGVYFVWYMAVLAVGCTSLIVWRWKELQAVHKIESLMSREFAFLLNNWILVAMMVTTLVLTTFPLISDWLWDQEVSVGP
ncbi:MAG: cytochrome c biogenesis protein CcsA, partial [Deltaproteobacteria bacterium]|nr:cytochrome c biogenesis protein CcsA [Deltaproteobacteria bacterium]